MAEKPTKKVTVNIDETELAEDISLPTDFAAAVMSARPELLKAIPPTRTLNAEETKAVIHALAVFMRTNLRLRRAVVQTREALKESIDGAVGNLNSLRRKLLEASYGDEGATP